MPRRARASGMPRAQPMMMGSLDFLEGEGEGSVGVLVGGGVVTTVRITVTMPVLSVERLVWSWVVGFTEVGGGVVFDGSVDWGELEPVVADELEPPPIALPVMVARLGAEDAVEDPTVA